MQMPFAHAPWQFWVVTSPAWMVIGLLAVMIPTFILTILVLQLHSLTPGSLLYAARDGNMTMVNFFLGWGWMLIKSVP